MTIERQWTVQSYMKRPSGELEVREQSLVKESMDVITTNETLCKHGPAAETPPGDKKVSNGNDNSNEPWLDRQINALTAVLGCGPLISLQSIGCAEESQRPGQSREMDTTVEMRDQGSPSTTMDNENGDVSILFWSQKKQTLTNADTSLEQTALHSSSSEDSRNDSKQQTDVEPNNNTFQRRLYCIISILLLLILGALLAVFLPNWDGRSGIQRSSSLASAVSSPTFAPTTAKPSMAPTYGEPAIVLTFLFDDFPEEISWYLLDSSAGMVVDDFPFLGYEPGIKGISHRIPVTINKEYTLTVSDEGLDGLCCETPGEYFVMFRGQQLVSGGGNFGAQVSHTFIIPEIL